MKKLFPGLTSLLSNAKVEIQLSGWPAAAAIASGCGTVLGGIYLLSKAGILQRLVSPDDDD